MAAFGAGTLPVMWSIAFWGNFINVQRQAKNTESISIHDDADGLPADIKRHGFGHSIYKPCGK